MELDQSYFKTFQIELKKHHRCSNEGIKLCCGFVQSNKSKYETNIINQLRQDKLVNQTVNHLYSYKLRSI